jgi:hypothetical protein
MRSRWSCRSAATEFAPTGSRGLVSRCSRRLGTRDSRILGMAGNAGIWGPRFNGSGAGSSGRLFLLNDALELARPVYRLSARHATFNNRSAASQRLVTHAGGRPSAAALGLASRRPDRANDGFVETGQKIGRRQTIEELGKIRKYKGCRRVQASDNLNINAINTDLD